MKLLEVESLVTELGETDNWLRAVNGISLTVNSVDGAVFSLNIIPHTQDVTTIGQWKVATPVNLEVDIIARYLERLLLGDKAAEPNAEGISMAFLAENGFLKGG